MKLAFLPIKRNSPFGGSEVLWSETALVAQKLGHEVHLFPYSFRVPNPNVLKLEKEGARVYSRNIRNLTIPFLLRVLLKHKASFNQRLNRADKSLRPLIANNYDMLVISQGSWFDLADDLELMRVLEKHQIPFVIVCHSFQDSGLLSTKRRQQILNMYEQAKHIFLVGERQHQVIEKLLTYKLEKFSIILNPLNLEHIEQIASPRSSTLKLVMISSLVTRWKGHDILLETLALEKWKARDWELYIYGEGEDMAEITRLIDFYGLNNHVKLRGYCKDVRVALAEVHALVMPSRVEAAPLTLYEAMLCGRPAVVTNVGDMGKLIENGFNGFVAEAAHPDSLDKALEALWARRQDIESLGQNAFNSVKDRFKIAPEEVFLEKIIKVAKS